MWCVCAVQCVADTSPEQACELVLCLQTFACLHSYVPVSEYKMGLTMQGKLHAKASFSELSLCETTDG